MRLPMRALGLWLTALVVGCGGTVVFEADGGQGGDGGAASSASATTTGASGTTTATSAATGSSTSGSSSVASVVSSSSGPGGCTSHEECPGGVCVFASGVCAVACLVDSCDRCTPGEVCEQCATSSCPACNDCVSACVPTPSGRCDDDDPCGGEYVCLFTSGTCAPGCGASECLDPNMVCDECGTSSGCGDDDCVGVCSPL